MTMEKYGKRVLVVGDTYFILCIYILYFVQWAAFEKWGRFDLVLSEIETGLSMVLLKFVLLILWRLMSGINVMQ